MSLRQQQQSNSNSGSSASTFKVVMLGEGSVGKTSLMNRYVNDSFNVSHIPTIRASSATKKLTVPDMARRVQRHVQLNISDTAGQEQYHALSPIYYRNAHGAVIVFDLTNVDTMHKVGQWVEEVRQNALNEIQIVIVGNKKDLVGEGDVTGKVAGITKQDLQDTILTPYNCTVINADSTQLQDQTLIGDICYCEASAKSGLNVDLVYLQLSKMMLNKFATSSDTQLQQSSKGVRISQHNPSKDNKIIKLNGSAAADGGGSANSSQSITRDSKIPRDAL
ncbi:hypothetical protein MIR68_009502 [Amoeboaphelidium protococcarum]|nr:hypothetical protein MIR68_009502 [Amoeboaphelidium protococcarum]